MAKTVQLAANAGRVTLPNGQTYETGTATEIRVLEISPGATGTYVLSIDGSDTNAIDVFASPETIEAEINEVSGVSDVSVYRGLPEHYDRTHQVSPDYEALLPIVFESSNNGFVADPLEVDASEVDGGTVRVRVVRERRSTGTVDVVLTDEEFAAISPGAFGSVLTDVTP